MSNKTRTSLHQSLRHLGCACLLPVVSLWGCADWSSQSALRSATKTNEACESSLTPAENTRLAGIEQMLNEGKFYAALAQLDALSGDSSKAQLIRAEALRRIDRYQESRALYQSLVGTCLEGLAQRGLGLIDARAGRLNDGLLHLQQARKLLPTDARIRNDLGYALLAAGRLDDAQFEFLTVLDLSPQDPKAIRNLVLLTFIQGHQDKAIELAKKLGLDAQTTDKLQHQAKTFAEKTPAPVPPPTSPAPGHGFE